MYYFALCLCFWSPTISHSFASSDTRKLMKFSTFTVALCNPTDMVIYVTNIGRGTENSQTAVL
jgi:hypothetical protein